MPFTFFKLISRTRRLITAATLVLLVAASSQAQSIDVSSPTPVVSNEIAGSIAPLDLGDPRSTRFFYTFNGLQGDLELTVESFNLEGDVDIFLAGNMRPLTKVTLYAGTGSNRSAKTVYLRRDEPLILRVQARTPNDAEGTYRIRLGGAFRPAATPDTGLAAPDESTAAANPSPGSPATGANRKVRRVSSVGARIEEPPVEVAREEPATPEPTPAAAAKKTPATPGTARPRAGGRRTSRAGTARRNPPNREAEEADAAKGEATNPGASDSDANDAARDETGAAEKPPRPVSRRPVRVPPARATRNSTASRRTSAPPAESVPASPAETTAPPAPASARLVLVMRDGETFERDMAGIRRVTVENGVLVIVSKTGKTERQPMNAVLRMSIEP
jgi:hypothetical protein